MRVGLRACWKFAVSWPHTRCYNKYDSLFDDMSYGKIRRVAKCKRLRKRLHYM